VAQGFLTAVALAKVVSLAGTSVLHNNEYAKPRRRNSQTGRHDEHDDGDENRVQPHQILKRFSDRPDISPDETFRSYWSELPREEVQQLFDLIAIEFGVSGGLLRPDDSLDKLVEPLATKNPLLWFAYQGAAGDKQNELSYELDKRLKKFGTKAEWPSISTIDELMRAWGGLRPPEKSSP
jgi:hypothetical protein